MLAHSLWRSTVYRLAKICLLTVLLGSVIAGCGGTEKGKNKDLDRPKATER